MGKAPVKRAKKRATCFEALLQNDLNSDVERFATHVQFCLVTNQLMQNFVAKTNGIMGNMKATDNA